MPLLSATGLTKTFGDVTVLAGVSLTLEPGEKAGLVGRNGAGKTTLLRLLAGLDVPDRGTAVLRAGAVAGYLAQLPDVPLDYTLWDEALEAFAVLRDVERKLAAAESRMASPEIHGDDARLRAALEEYGRLRERFERAGGFGYEAEARRTLAGLGFREDQYRQPLASMSGGQRSRAALARLLLSGPDLLLLDEPTNHLDLEALEWLQAFLQSYHGALLLVSHDRYLLDAVTSRTLDLEDGRLEEYPGHYSLYVTEREARRVRQQEAFERQQEEIEVLKAYIRRYHAGQKSRQAKSREKRLARITPVEAPRTARALTFRLDAPRRGPQTVVRLRNVTKRYGTTPVLRHVAVEIHRGEKVGLIGPNGTGKTTLLRIIAGLEPPTSGVVEVGAGVRIGYFAQHAEDTLDATRSVLDEVLGARPLGPEQVRTVLGRFLFSGEAVYKKIAQLSGGERRRVALAKMVLDRPNLLLLDEPTTHLDLPSLEMLESALRAFAGAMILVSHDRYLLDHVAGRLLILTDGEVVDVPGPYHSYRDTLAAVASADAPWRGHPGGCTRAGAGRQAARRAGRVEGPVAAALPPGSAQPTPERREGPERQSPRGTERDAHIARPPEREGARRQEPDVPPGREPARRRTARTGGPTSEEIMARIGALEREQGDLSRVMGDPELYRDADRARRTVQRYEEISAALESLYAALDGVEE